jgi:hypothetical protein
VPVSQMLLLHWTPLPTTTEEKRYLVSNGRNQWRMQRTRISHIHLTTLYIRIPLNEATSRIATAMILSILRSTASLPFGCHCIQIPSTASDARLSSHLEHIIVDIAGLAYSVWITIVLGSDNVVELEIIYTL